MLNRRNEVVSLMQSKTGEPLSLPMNVHIGNELFDYLTIERANAELEGPILRQQRSTDRSLGTVAGILSKIFKIAGIRPNAFGGLRLMRHNLVTTLLGQSTACEVVSSIVGHRCPESLRHYADSDIDHLRACALSIEDYPMPPKLFFDLMVSVYGKTVSILPCPGYGEFYCQEASREQLE
jgi:Phage integrase family.